MASHRPKSDSQLLRRLINNLRERGSEVAEELEKKAHNFLNDVKSKRKVPIEVLKTQENIYKRNQPA